MSTQYKLKKSRECWKKKASSRADENRCLRKKIICLKSERDSYKRQIKEVKNELKSQRASQGKNLAVKNKVDLVFLALQLFLVTRISFRAVSRVLKVLCPHLRIKRAPCTQTIINWVNRLSIVRIQYVHELVNLHTRSNAYMVKNSSRFIWIIDISIALGAGKILAVLAVDIRHYHENTCAPTLRDVHCVAVAVDVSWNGESIANFLQKAISKVGPPAAYLKDRGSDLRKATRLLQEQGLSSDTIDDISHVAGYLRLSPRSALLALGCPKAASLTAIRFPENGPSILARR